MEDTWQFKCNDSNSRTAYLLKSSQWTDCTFLVGLEPDQEVIKAHKLILASASPMFEAMFYGKMAETQSPIPIPDVKPKAFRMMLEYIYAEEEFALLCSFEDTCNLLYVATKSLLVLLEKKCVSYLNTYLIYVRYLCPLYEMALLYQETKLMQNCLEVFSHKTKAILKDKSFKEAQLSTVVAIFSLEKMDCTELDLFEALKRYAKALEDDDHPPESKKKSIVRTLVQKIRFLSLTPREFADGPAKSGLLTQSEVSAIFMNIASDKSDVPMPDGFSTCRETRVREKYCKECKKQCGH